MNIRILYFLCFLILISCHKEQENQNIEIDLSKKKTKFSSIFLKVNKIPLESKEGFYLSDSPRLCGITANNQFIILDNVIKRQISVYNSNGIGLRKIGNEGRGPGEYLYPEDIYWNGEKFYLLDSDLLRLSIYNAEFQYIEDFNIKYPFYQLITVGNKIFCYRSNMAYKSMNNDVVFTLDHTAKIINHFHRQSENYNVAAEAKGGGITVLNNYLFVITPYEYSINKYTLTGKSVKKVVVSSPYYKSPNNDINIKKVTSQAKNLFEYHKTWSPILQLLKIGEKIAVIYKIPQEEGNLKLMDIYSQNFELLHSNIVLMSNISNIISRNNKIFFLEDKYLTDDGNILKNPHIMIYKYKSDAIK